MAYGTFKGSKYSEKLSRVEIAKLIRKDLHAKFPTIKFSVKCPRGRAIDVEIQSFPNSSGEVLNWDRWLHDKEHPYSAMPARGVLPILADIAGQVVTEVEAICNAYNFDHSEIETDYFHVNFYLNVNFSRELYERDRKAFEARHERLKLAGKQAAPVIELKRSEADETLARWEHLLKS